nr:uncharacterized protein LOC123770193 [Procambarus clarkii]
MKASLVLVILCVSLMAGAEADGGVPAGSPQPSGSDAAASGTLSEQRYGPEHNEHGSGGEFEEHEHGCAPRRLCDENEGVCRRSCNGPVENEVHNGCGGNGCKCCTRKNKKHCTSNVECREHGGRCTQAKCKNHEVLIRRGCKGQGCNCCVPNVRDAEGVVNEETQVVEEVEEEGGEEKNESYDVEEEDEEE